MKLNRTPNPLDRAARNSENDNWDIIEGEVRTIGERVDDLVEEISDEAFNKIVDSARLDWDKMVDTFGDLPTNAKKGTTIGVKSDSKVYRYDGSNWIDIYEINLNPISEVEDRLSTQLADEAQQRKKEIQKLDEIKANRGYVDNFFSKIGSGRPKGAFPTLSDLENTYPNGNDNIYVIAENNKWYYWNGSSWQPGGLYNATVSDEFPVTNYIKNGDFSNGTSGWETTRASIEVENNTLKIIPDGTDGLPGVHQLTNFIVNGESKVYVKVKAKVSSEATGFRINPYVSGSNYISFTDLKDEWQEFSAIFNIDDVGQIRIYFYTEFLTKLPELADITLLEYVVAVDLTETFGAGKEPSLDEMDEYMDKFPNRWFDGTISPFLSQKELIVYQRDLQSNVQRVDGKIDALNSKIDSLPTVPIKQPMPPTVTPDFIPLGNVRFKFMESDGTMWGTNGSRVVKSTDGENWEDVLTIDLSEYGEIYATGLMATETGRLLIGTMFGNVLVTNEEKTSYSLAFTFGGGGRFSTSLANKSYENYYFIGAYNSDATGDNYNNEVWMSEDYGATWNKIFTGTVVNPNRNYHIHDIEFDPWGKRIYISVGDMENRNLFYSDDFGENWVKLFDEFDEFGNLQPTQIIAYFHGIIFGSDDAEHGGLHYLPRDKGLNQLINTNDIVPDFYPIPNGPSEAPSFFAVKSFVLRTSERQLSLMPFRHMHYPGALSRLMASEDGFNWFEIWRAKESDIGLTSIFGTEDGKTAVGQYSGDGRYLFKIDVPEFI